MMKNLFFFTTLFLFSFLVAFSQEYRAIPLIHPAGNLFVSGLNNQGQVCGTVLVDDVNFFNNAVRFEPDGTFSTLALGDLGQSSTASAINDLGHVLGTISRSDFTTAVVIWESDSTYRELEQPDGFASVLPQDLNNKGEAVGYIFNFGGANEAIFWDADGILERLPQPEGGAEAQVLNDSSEIVGKVYDADGQISLVKWKPVDTASQRSFLQYDFPATLGGPVSQGDFFFFNNNGQSGGSLDGRAILHDNETGLTDLGPGELDAGNLAGDYSGFIGDGQFGPQPRVNIDGQEVDPQLLTDQDIFFAGRITDRRYLQGSDPIGTDYLMIPNFHFTVESTADENPALNIYNDFKQNMVNQLDEAFAQAPSMFPVTIEVGQGEYRDEPFFIQDGWAPKTNFSVSNGVRIEEVETESGTEVHWQPRLGLAHNPKGDPLRVNRYLAGGDTEFGVITEINEFILRSDVVQNVLISDLIVFDVGLFENDNNLTQLDGIIAAEAINFERGIIRAIDSQSRIELDNYGYDDFSDLRFIPNSGSPSSVANESRFFDGTFERQSGPINVWGAPDVDEGFYFPIGLEDQATPVITQPTGQTISSPDIAISVQAFNLVDTEIEDQTVMVDGNFATEVISPRVYRVGVRLRFRNRDLADPIEANIRIPVLDLENVEDPNRYRLLLFDCDGNFQGQAGLFMPPNDDTQGSLLYTGINDSVLNITHTKVLLDSCQYLAVARGITTTSVSENPGWDRGFRFNRIYPNPSVGEANVEISIPETSEVKTTMYNVIGQAVWTKNEGRVVEGNHTISINDLALVPGAYHCQIEFSDAYGSDFHYIQSKKLILLE